MVFSSASAQLAFSAFHRFLLALVLALFSFRPAADAAPDLILDASNDIAPYIRACDSAHSARVWPAERLSGRFFDSSTPPGVWSRLVWIVPTPSLDGAMEYYDSQLAMVARGGPNALVSRLEIGGLAAPHPEIHLRFVAKPGAELGLRAGLAPWSLRNFTWDSLNLQPADILLAHPDNGEALVEALLGACDPVDGKASVYFAPLDSGDWLSNLAGLRVGGEPAEPWRIPEPERPGVLRLATWDIQELGNRNTVQLNQRLTTRTLAQLHAVADWIEAIGPAVLSLQEINRREPLQAILDRLNLEGGDWRAWFPGTPDANGVVAESNAILYNTQKAALVEDSGEIWRELRSPPYSSGDDPRVALFPPLTAVFEARDGSGYRFRIVNAHHHNHTAGHSYDEDEAVRAAEARALRRKLEELADAADAGSHSPMNPSDIYLLGDCYLMPGGSAAEDILTSGGMLARIPIVNGGSTLMNWPAGFAEACYASPSARARIAEGARVVRPAGEDFAARQAYVSTYSDHCALYLDARTNRETSAERWRRYK